MGRQVFVSYSYQDRSYVAELAGFLRAAGVEVWADDAIRYGERWEATVRQRIGECGAVVVVMTPRAQESRWVSDEIAFAEAMGRPVVPLLLAGVPHFSLGHLRWENVLGGRMPSAEFVAELRRLTGKDPAGPDGLPAGRPAPAGPPPAGGPARGGRPPTGRTIDFGRLIDERTAHFVGREYVIDAIDAILGDPDFPSGYIHVRGEPGIGKTALLCQLVKTRGYVHHFNIAPEGIRGARTFLGNVCAQLAARYLLDAEAPPEAMSDSALLSRLLAEAAAAAGHERVVVVVDALDEADDDGADGANRLFLPATLPRGVVFIVSSREQADYRLDVSRRRHIALADDDPRNVVDVRRYVERHFASHELGARFAGLGLTAGEFADELVHKSQGNFMYLVYVLDDLRSGRLSISGMVDVHNLPAGLRGYYERLWRTMRGRDPERFERIYEPVLRVLAVVREPVTIPTIEEMTRLSPARIVDVLREWRQFLNVSDGAPAPPRYRIYHSSFQDFLAAEGVGLQPYHEHIVDLGRSKL